ncbi:MAG TPA: hypothetical protein VGK06_08400 [Methanosarcina sp.]|jgi:hypothetical protein
MTEPKRRQGQKKANGTKATPKPLCPKCGEILKRNYTREVVNGKQQYIGAGWSCPSKTCDYIVKDLVEIEEEAVDGTDKAGKIKKLTAEFIKTHERLNELAEQIKELETE